MNFIDFFAGIGGFREGLTRNGFVPVGWCEKDKFAQKAYRIIHEPEGEWFADDITTVRPEELPETDLYCGGFPCQSFSIAGKRGGFSDTRGTLFFEIMRLAKARQPKYLFLENVKGLLSHDGGRTFATIINTLWECGYNAEWQVLNSKNFGVSQNRERVFIVGYLGGQPRPEIFPIRRTNQTNLKQLNKGRNPSNRLYDINGVSCTLKGGSGGRGAKTGLYLVNKDGNCIKIKHKGANCIDANYYKGLDSHRARTGVLEVRSSMTPDRIIKKQNGRRFKEPGEPSFTLTKDDTHGIAIYQRPRGNNAGGMHNISPTLSVNSWEQNNHLLSNCRIRRLTPLECFRLQSFPDEWYYKLREHISETQLYRLAGNAVTINVIEEIGRRLPCKPK